MSGVSYCVESVFNVEGGNGRVYPMVFADEQEAEKYTHELSRLSRDEAYFVTSYPFHNNTEWRAEWFAARDRVKTFR